MCGICGILDDQRRLACVHDMAAVQRHRGPDDEGYIFVNTETNDWRCAGGADTPAQLGLRPVDSVQTGAFDMALGSRRLAILDLSPAGHMPMSYLGGALWIVYNGEVYNYRELRAQLLDHNYPFSSETDTEVILAAYLEWGVDCLARMNGMFAFAVWDGRKRQLFCARDRFGVKPFYYFWNGSTFAFASEIKALIQHPAVHARPNDRAVFDYLALGLSDHEDGTFFDGILSLTPGHYLTLDAPTRRLAKHRWWQLTINSEIGSSPRTDEHPRYAEFADLLEDAVRLRLRSDVAIGSCLSGGLDSSAVVLLANRLLLDEQVVPPHLVGNCQKTFTARNHEIEIDEYRYSREVVRRTRAEENVTFPSAQDLWGTLETFVWHMGEPVNSTSQFAQWSVMRLARQRGVTVLLDGQGGDEILAGYYSYLPTYLNQMHIERGLPAVLRAGWDVCRVGGWPAANTLLDSASSRLPWRVRMLLSLVRRPRLLPGHGGSGLASWQLSGDFLQRHWDRRWLPSADIHPDGLAALLCRDITSTNLPKLLRYEDRNSMAFSLETRLPLLDYRLVEMVFSLPLNYRIRNGWTKWILRRSLSTLLPSEICWRRSKLGFPTPEIGWLQQGASIIRELLRGSGVDLVAPYLDATALRAITDLRDPDLASMPGLWRIANLIVWARLFLNSKPAYPSSPLTGTAVGICDGTR